MAVMGSVLGGAIEWHVVFNYLVMAVTVLAFRLTVVQPDQSLEKVLGQAVLDALHSPVVRLTTKQAAGMMQVSEGNLHSMLRGEGRFHLGIVHLARLPLAFWGVFGPTLFALMAKQNIQQITEDLGLRKSA